MLVIQAIGVSEELEAKAPRNESRLREMAAREEGQSQSTTQITPGSEAFISRFSLYQCMLAGCQVPGASVDSKV